MKISKSVEPRSPKGPKTFVVVFATKRDSFNSDQRFLVLFVAFSHTDEHGHEDGPDGYMYYALTPFSLLTLLPPHVHLAHSPQKN